MPRPRLAARAVAKAIARPAVDPRWALLAAAAASAAAALLAR